jgi:3-oxoacyl-[acyl-carrier-protein] synthase II
MVSAAASSRVVITGMGAVSALGTGCDELWRAVAEGRDGLRPAARFDTSVFPSAIAGLWPAWDDRREDEMAPERDLQSMAERFPVVEMARVAADEAWSGAQIASRIGAGTLDPRRVALVLGTCFGQGFRLFHEVAEALAEGLGIAGPRLTVSTACSSSTNAVGIGRDLLCAGRADVVLAGGADVVLREVFAGFCALGVVSAQKCAPFSEPPGINLGEGAGFVVLERDEDRTPGATAALAAVLGYGLSSDGFHETTPDPSGAGIARAVRGALADAGLPADAIDYVNAHATGTESHDRAEWAAIQQALGGRSVAVSASKSFLGHAQGAAGILELIVTVLGLGHGVVPPTLRFDRPRPGCPEDPIRGTRPRALPVRHALDVSAAFGGANAVLAVSPIYSEPSKGSAPPAMSSARRSRATLDAIGPDPSVRPAKIESGQVAVVVRGLGAIGPHGTRVAALAAAAERRARLWGDAADFDFARIANADPRRMDRSARLLTAAAALALADGGVKIKGALRDQAGVFLGATRMPAESSFRCIESIERHGVGACSAASFARMSVNAPAGACAKLLGLRGPSTTLAAGPTSGLLAIVLAAEWLAGRRDADLLLAAGLDERPPSAMRERSPDTLPDTDGAVCALLAREALDATSSDHRVVVAGTGLAGPGDAAAVTRAALAGGGRPDAVWGDGAAARRAAPADVPFTDVGELWQGGEACGSAVAVLLAVEAIRAGRVRTALAVAARGDSAAGAILLARQG